MTKQPGWKALDFTKPPVEKKRLFYFDRVDGKEWVTVKWGGYDYDIELDRIPDPLALLQWLAHLGEKEWKGMTPDEISAFIQEVARRKGWELWAKHY